MKTVILVKSSELSPYRKKQDGILQYAKKQSWNIQIMEPIASAKDAGRIIDLWNPDGFIINCGSGANDFDSKALKKVPTVFIDRPLKNMNSEDSYVYHDSRASAALATRELLLSERETYAYVHWTRHIHWDSERNEAFSEFMRLHGHRTVEFRPRSDIYDTLNITIELQEWIGKLKKPVGIFATTDIISARVASACRRCALSIPGDVSIIGIDNDEEICEHSNPSLSSIAPDYKEAGRQAAQTLDYLMSGGSPQRLTYGPSGIVRRKSTRIFSIADRHVSEAVELIRKEACHGLTAEKALAVFPCSRRMAELRFRRATGHSPLEEIQSVRIAKAKDLLNDSSYDISAIANYCGYATIAAFSKFFKAGTGIPPSKWRKDNTDAPGSPQCVT
jgi:LacI family transcriptional regulator